MKYLFLILILLLFFSCVFEHKAKVLNDGYSKIVNKQDSSDYYILSSYNDSTTIAINFDGTIEYIRFFDLRDSCFVTIRDSSKFNVIKLKKY